MVFKSLLKLLKGEEEKINFKKSNNGILPVEKYIEIEVEDVEEKEGDIIRIKVLDLKDRKDANEILVWVENGCIVIANTVDLEREVDERYLNVINYLKEEVLKIRGKVVRICNNRILVLPKNVKIEKAVREEEEENQSIEMEE